MRSSLNAFHPIIQSWFKDTFGQPTDIQDRSWPLIASGKHVLITAPTGSGKTLTAFLWAINQLITGEWSNERTRVLYVSPLKALNNDIRRNLEQPLAEISNAFKAEGVSFPAIRVFTRSGDTPQSDRRRMLRHPPEILITTPESLNLLLSSKSGQEVLTSLSTVILDEIHAVVGEKRGVHLITAVDRLVRLSGEFQRIALSATVKPMETVAEFIGGFQLSGVLKNPEYAARTVSTIQSSSSRIFDINIRFPETEIQDDIEDPVWTALAESFKDIISNNRSTLLFVNSRKLSEKLTYKINSAANQMVAYAHHGSLSKQIREEVEQKLKKGELKAIVATSSLEMGIDIGDLDEVVLIQCPGSISSAIQRIGRAGHKVGEISKGTIFPSHPQDFIGAAVLAEAIDQQDIEPVQPIQCPLDVLSQVVISMVGIESWDLDELFAWITTSYPYRFLSREQFDMVLKMLAGRYAESRIRELKPRVSIDRLDNTIEAKKGALMALYTSGGTIPDRGYYQLRHHETGARIGELDEEYVWEARIGQLATIGTQNWRIQRITHNDVFATPANNQIMNTPFWKSEEYGRDFHFSKRLLNFLESANNNLDEPEFRLELANRYHMNPVAIRQLIEFLHKQKEETQSDLPHRHHILLEYVNSGPDGAPGSQLVIHTLWGGKLNRPFAMAMDSAWEEIFGERLEIFPGNDSIILQLAHSMKPEEILTLVQNNTLESMLKKRLEGSGFFGARFRECAGRALLITRNKFNQRMPFWMNRLRSQKLMESVLKYDDFPILLETWRTCLQDEFDLPNLREVLGELETGVISWSITQTQRPSPFAAGMTWNQIDKYMYQQDQPASITSSLRGSLLQEVVFNPGLRPSVPEAAIKRYEKKRQRLAEGYSPQTPRDLIDWVKERVLIPFPEWKALISAIERDTSGDQEVVKQAISKLAMIQPLTVEHPLVAAIEFLPRIMTGFYSTTSNVKTCDFEGKHSMAQSVAEIEADQVSNLFTEWCSFYGPKTKDFIQSNLGLDHQLLETLIDESIQSQTLISGPLVTDIDDLFYCDSENFESLLRINRADAQPVFEPLDIKQLPLFLAHFQGITRKGESIEDLFRNIEQLVCHSLPAESWEADVLPARVHNYQSSLLDSILQEGDLNWVGCGKERFLFCFQPDLDMLQSGQFDTETDEMDHSNEPDAGSLMNFFNHREGRYNFATLQQLTGLNPGDLSESIWDAVWKGQLTNDGFAALRKGIENKFQFKITIVPDQMQSRRGRRSSGRSGFAKWKGTLPYAGNWFPLPDVGEPADLIEQEELNKDRVRLLMDRYGIIFRELLYRELPAFSWRSLFRSLRLMELSGEILAGYFFESIPGPQFISHQAFRTIQAALPEESIYWMNATDPASLCGVAIESLKASLPRRLQSNHIVFKGSDIVLISERNGKSLTFNVEPDDQKIQEILAPLKHLLYRSFMPLKQIVIESINQADAAHSPYLEALRTSFETLVEFKKVTLYRKL